MPRRPSRPILALLLIPLLIAACGGTSSEAATLPGTSWTATTIAGQAVIAASAPTMDFGSDGRLSGSSGCNSFSGSYTTDGDSLTVTPLASTLMLCADEAVNLQETAFLAALQGATTWSIGSDGNLTLAGVAVIVAKPGAPS